ncbi:MAG: hypothetical protein JSS74_11675 [Actinobacteria bacterium]|nr:hypothetical protein [Actinomycetota bacterium]
MARNLFPDPTIATPGATDVVRTNRALQPNPTPDTVTMQWGNGAGTLTNENTGPGGAAVLRVQVDIAMTGGTRRIQIAKSVATGQVPVVAGEQPRISVPVAATGGEWSIDIDYRGPGGTYLSSSVAATRRVVSANPAEPTLMVGTGAAAPAGAASMVVFVRDYVDLPAGTSVWVGTWGVGDGVPFSGDASPDPDMRAAWTGAVNGSSSTLSVELVPGVTATDCLAIRSGIWGAADGAMSMRTIPTGPAPAVTIANAPGAATMLATRRDPGDVVTEIRENINGPAILHPSPTQDTWYDQLGIMAGDYSGLWFSGDTAERLGRTYAWDGDPNASASTETYRPNVFVPAPVQIPDGWRLAQALQAQNAYNANNAAPGNGDLDGGSYGITIHPLDWQVKQLLRPQRATGAIA